MKSSILLFGTLGIIFLTILRLNRTDTVPLPNDSDIYIMNSSSSFQLEESPSSFYFYLPAEDIPRSDYLWTLTRPRKSSSMVSSENSSRASSSSSSSLKGYCSTGTVGLSKLAAYRKTQFCASSKSSLSSSTAQKRGYHRPRVNLTPCNSTIGTGSCI